jgi:serine/threonine-protein kinase RsbW
VRARNALDTVRLDGATRYNAELVFEEVIANVVGHGAPDGHALEVRFTLEVRPDSIILTFDDNGVPFDPRGRADPPPQKSLDEARIGGYGLMLVRRVVSSLDYLRTAEGHNRLTVRLPRRAEGETR